MSFDKEASPMNILDSMSLLQKILNQYVTEDTVWNCFRKAGFVKETSLPAEVEDEHDVDKLNKFDDDDLQIFADFEGPIIEDADEVKTFMASPENDYEYCENEVPSNNETYDSILTMFRFLQLK